MGDHESLTTAHRFMKLVLIAVIVLVVAGSIFADYQWRRWMARNRRDRDQ